MDFLLTECEVPYLPLYIQHDGEPIAVIVDKEDYAWAVRHKWQAKPSRKRANGKLKLYACRASVREKGRRRSIYLHKEICHRAHGPPPSPAHKVADHKFSDTLDCRRASLRWATLSENRRNIEGSEFHA